MTPKLRLRALLCACAAAFVSTAVPVYAEDAQRCHGVDMLGEMQTKSPTLYKTVMDQSRATANTEALLWKIEKPGVAPSYLL